MFPMLADRNHPHYWFDGWLQQGCRNDCRPMAS
jgi:hypothetical protein